MNRPDLELDTDRPGAIDGRQLRAAAFLDVRMSYFHGVLAAAGRSSVDGSVLVVGDGRGLLSRALARSGLTVVAVETSSRANELAAAVAAEHGLEIEYRSGPLNAIDVEEQRFDACWIFDTLEVVDDVDEPLAFASRALKDGGLLCYDTVNRTVLARMVYLGLFQRFPPTRIMPAGRYRASRLRTPQEVSSALDRQRLRPAEVCDFKPSGLRALVTAILDRRRGRTSDEQAGARAAFVLNPSGKPVVTYLGHATRLPRDGDGDADADTASATSGR